MIGTVLLHPDVVKSIAEDYTKHIQSGKAAHETGWLLFGRPNGRKAYVLCAVGGGDNDSSSSHFTFDLDFQIRATRLLLQQHPWLRLLGVLHTHPGSMNYPSSGDFRGDSRWVTNLPFKEGVFGIGIRKGKRLIVDWYGLHEDDEKYRKLNDKVLGRAGRLLLWIRIQLWRWYR